MVIEQNDSDKSNDLDYRSSLCLPASRRRFTIRKSKIDETFDKGNPHSQSENQRLMRSLIRETHIHNQKIKD